MNRLLILAGAAVVALGLSACATDTGDEEFLGRAWETSKETTDQVAKEGVEAMPPANEKAQGFFHHLWD